MARQSTGTHTMSNDATPRDAAPSAHPPQADDDANNPRTRTPADQMRVWEEEGGSPPGRLGATASVKPRKESKAGSMGARS